MIKDKIFVRDVRWAALLIGAVVGIRFLLIYTGGLFPSGSGAAIVHALAMFLVVFFALCMGMRFIARWYGGELPDRAIAMWLAFGVLLWAQGNLLLWDYGTLDGRPMHFASYHWYGLGELVLWAGILVLAWKYATWWRAKAKAIALIILVTQMGALVQSWAAMPDVWFRRYELSYDNYYHYSRNKNVIIVVLDAARSDITRKILEASPKKCALYSGFTLFENTTGTFNTTNPAVSGILTGALFDNKEPNIVAFTRMFTTGDSLPYRLKRAGFISEIYPLSPESVYLAPSLIDNLRSRNFVSKGDVKKLMPLWRVVGFNFSPHFLKMALFSAQNTYLFNETDQPPVTETKEEKQKKEAEGYSKLSDAARANLVISRDRIERFSKDLAFDLEPNLFRFMHFYGAHPPFIHDENFQDAPMPFEMASYTRQLAGAMKTPEALIASLKRAGKYDDTMLIIIGDHGLYLPDGKKPSGLLGHPQVDTNLPLLMIKPFGAVDVPINISRAPVSLFDLPATVLSALGMEYEAGRPVFSVKENERRARFSYSMELSGVFEHSALLEYEINGPARELSSWKHSGRYLPYGEGFQPLDEDALRKIVYGHRAYLDNTARFIP